MGILTGGSVVDASGAGEPDGWREMSAAVLQGRGLAGLAEALYQMTGRPVVIEVTGDGVLASAGDPDEIDLRDVTEGGAGMPTLFDPDPAELVAADLGVGATRRESSAGEVSQAPGQPAARRPPWWVAPVIVDGAAVAGVKLHDPHASATPEDLLALELAASTAALQLLLDRARTERDNEVWADFAGDLLEDSTPERVQRHARRFGFDLDEPYRAVVIEPAGRPPFRFAGRCQTVVAADASRPFVAVEREGRVILAIGDELPWQRLAEHLTEVLGTPLRIGVGGREPLRNIRRSVTDAEAAIRIGSPADEPRLTVSDDLGVWRILARAADVDLDEFIDRWLGPILRYDAARHAELVKSLTTYFECNSELDAAAAKLFVHRNTLKYRLTRIAEISGVDLSDARQRLHLELACEAWGVRRGSRPGPDA